MKKIFGMFLLIQAFSAFATSDLFSIVPVGTLPTVMYDGQVTTVQYTVTNKSIYTLNNNALRYAPEGQTPSGVTQITTGAGVCGTTFDLAAGASCTLSLLITSDNFTNNVAKGGPEVCNTATHAVHCSVPSPGDQLNILNNGIFISPYFTLTPMGRSQQQSMNMKQPPPFTRSRITLPMCSRIILSAIYPVA